MEQSVSQRFRSSGAGPPVAAVVVVDLSPYEAKRISKRLTVVGILFLLGGLAAIAVPSIASVAIAIFIGWMLVFGAVTAGVHAFSEHGRTRTALWALSLVTLLTGLTLVIFPLTGTITLTIMLAAWFFATGAVILYSAIQNRGAPGNGFLMFNAVTSLILGVLIAADLPSSAEWAIGLLVGINLILWGVRALIAAQLLRSWTSR